MLVGITILLVFQLIGEISAYFLGGFVPGPVIGMAMVAVVLTLTGGMTFLEPAHRQLLRRRLHAGHAPRTGRHQRRR